jgi:hypothetical protein
MNWLLALIDAGIIMGVLEPGDEALIVSCFDVRGRTKGCLASRMPSRRDNGPKHAAWCALMSTLSACNVSIGSMLWMKPEAKAVFERIDDWTNIKEVRFALNAYGQRPCQYNLWDYHNGEHGIDPDAFAARVYRAIDRQLAEKAYA